MKQRSSEHLPSGVFQHGTLWTRVRKSVRHALDCGALEPIRTRSVYCEDKGQRFLVRVVSSLREKPSGDDEFNPFLPYEKDLHVADASTTHVCILNKYNVVDHHLLITTRCFEHQETALAKQDFYALWKCLLEYGALGFYNSGVLSGASQKHKHLQVVPLPLVAAGAQKTPTMEQTLGGAALPPGKITQVDAFPFRHAVVRWEDPARSDLDSLSELSESLYQEMLHYCGVNVPRAPSELLTAPYNLLVTRRWMMLVPRSQECYYEISLNALAFLGALLVQDEEQLARLRQAGPLSALAAVGLAQC